MAAVYENDVDEWNIAFLSLGESFVYIEASI